MNVQAMTIEQGRAFYKTDKTGEILSHGDDMSIEALQCKAYRLGYTAIGYHADIDCWIGYHAKPMEGN